jgi:hypothetical protein
MKVRHFPHENNQWVTHVSVEVSIDTKHLTIPSGFTPLFSGDDPGSLHVSLSPLFSLKYYQVEPFKRSCKKLAEGIGRQCVSFHGGEYLPDASKIFTFYALDVVESEYTKSVFSSFQRIRDSYIIKELEHFEEEIPHLSIAKCEGMKQEKPPQHQQIVGIFNKLVCSFGGKKVEYQLQM